MLKHIKNGNGTHTYCEDCGCEMPFKATIIMNNIKKNCPKCGREYFVETPEIDWTKIANNNK